VHDDHGDEGKGAAATGRRTVAPVLDSWLLEVLATPDTHAPLHQVDETTLYDPAGRRAYRIDGGIPVLLVDEARPVDDEEHARFAAVIAAGGPERS